MDEDRQSGICDEDLPSVHLKDETEMFATSVIRAVLERKEFGSQFVQALGRRREPSLAVGSRAAALSQRLREATHKLENEQEFLSLLARLDVSSDASAYTSFYQVARNVVTNGVSWSRVAGVMVFAGKLAAKLMAARSDGDEQSRHSVFLMVVSWTARFLRDRLWQWMIVNSGPVRMRYMSPMTMLAGTTLVPRLEPQHQLDYCYRRAISKGHLKMYVLKLDLFGEGEAGKTCLGDAFLDLPFQKQRASTKGTQIKMMIRSAASHDGSWKGLLGRGRESEINELLVGGTLMSNQDPPHKGAEVETDGHQLRSGTPKPKAMQKLPTLGLNEFVSVRNLTQKQSEFRKRVESDKDELLTCGDIVIATVWDRGGQEAFRSTHAALMAECTQYSPTGYLLVFDLTKHLKSLVNTGYRVDMGRTRILPEGSRSRTYADSIRYILSAVKMAHPSSQHPSNFLGKGKVKRPPAMFMVGTHKDELKKHSDSLEDEQEEILQRLISEQDYGEQVVLASESPNRVTFQVDNTRSGTGSPDPILVYLRDLIIEMTKTYWDKVGPIPMPWAVLDKSLHRVAELPQNRGKIMNVADVTVLAERLCDIPTDDECKSALIYLASLGVILYYYRIAVLREKVFTDPQWLMNILSTFITVLDRANVKPELWCDLETLQQNGRMSWSLAEYLLEKSGVWKEEYPTILTLLGEFDLIFPIAGGQLAPLSSFFVPDMLIEDHDGKFKWQTSQSLSLPPSLVFRPESINSCPASLFSRVVCRCASHLSLSSPLLKRDYAIFRLGREMELEMVYWQQRYIIATVYALDEASIPNESTVRMQCVHIREFVTEQVNEAKVHGMEGFDFTVCVGVQHDTEDQDVLIDDKSLVRVDNYDPSNPMLVSLEGQGVAQSSLPGLDLWFLSKGSEDQAIDFSSSDIPLDLTDTVADLCRSDWRQLGRELGISNEELFEYESDKYRTLKEKAHQVIFAWQRREGETATVSLLLKVCDKLKKDVRGRVKARHRVVFT